MELYPSGQFGFTDDLDCQFGNRSVWTRTRIRSDGPEPLLTLPMATTSSANTTATYPRGCPQPQLTDIHPTSELKDSGPVTHQLPHPVVPSLRDYEAARMTPDVDVVQQPLGEYAGGNSLPIVPPPDVPLPNVPLPEASMDGSVGG